MYGGGISRLPLPCASHQCSMEGMYSYPPVVPIGSTGFSNEAALDNNNTWNRNINIIFIKYRFLLELELDLFKLKYF